MDIVYDGEFCYRSPSSPHVGWCHLQVLRGKTSCLLLSAELPDNPGLPLKNAVVLVLTQAINLFGLDPTKLQYIQHCPATTGRIEYYHVTIEWKDLPNLPHHPIYEGRSRMDLGEVNAFLDAL